MWQRQASDYVAPSVCGRLDLNSYLSDLTCGTQAPFGCAGAELYLRWYADLKKRGVNLTAAHSYHTSQGEREGRSWPLVDPCVILSTKPESGLLSLMVARWQERAKQRGWPGLHIVGTANKASMRKLDALRRVGTLDALQDHLPSAFNSDISSEGPLAVRLSTSCARESAQLYTQGYVPECDCLLRATSQSWVDEEHSGGVGGPHYRGAWATWSNFPRYSNESAPGLNTHKSQGDGFAFCRNASSSAYSSLLETQLERAVRDVRASTGKQSASFVLVNAWNEWGEQAAIEPTVEDGHAMLEATRSAIDRVELRLEAEI